MNAPCKAITHSTWPLRDAMQAAGLVPPDDIISDGALHRFASNGKRGDDAGWYREFPDGEGAAFGCWREGISEVWFADTGSPITPAERAARQARIATLRAEAEATRAVEQAAKAELARKIWQAAQPVLVSHAYLDRKGIQPHCAKTAIAETGLRDKQGKPLTALRGPVLLIPGYRDKKLVMLQAIQPDGERRFIGSPDGAACPIGGKGAFDDPAVVLIAEGFATAASLNEATGHPALCAFSKGNLLAVAMAARTRWPNAKLILCADRDADGGGEAKAREAAKACGGAVVLPDFTGVAGSESASDFNDLHQIAGLDAVRLQLSQVSQPGQADPPASAEADHHGSYHMGNRHDAGDWPEPQPLTVKVEPEPYPLDALPETLRAAVEEVAAFVKAPIPMVVASALGAISLAAQGHIDVKRAERLQGPVGLFLLTIADSGERKSTCDGFFTAAIRDYQAEQAEAAKPLIKDYKANKAAWEAKGSGIKEKIRQLAKEDKPTSALEETLRELERSEPEPPRVPRLLYGDATPEKLSYSLAKEWPSGGVVSAEAGIVFGSHGMGADSVMRNMALLNILWDGGEQIIDRRGSESYTVRGARLTVALQVQELTLRSFFERAGGLARGTGFLARFLVSWPESTQGHRPFSEAPPHWPHLAVFHRRITAILGNPAPIAVDGALSPALLTLTPEAKAAWVEYHDAIEGELISGGELYDVRDVASKTADNAVRLAALFQFFEHGMGGAVGLPAFEGASRIAAWHLNESRRFFGELALPKELADATRLDCWLTEHCRGNQTHLVPTREAQRLGPVRDKERLTVALRELEELDRVRVTQEGRRKTIKVNPALAGVAA